MSLRDEYARKHAEDARRQAFLRDCAPPGYARSPYDTETVSTANTAPPKPELKPVEHLTLSAGYEGGHMVTSRSDCSGVFQTLFAGNLAACLDFMKRRIADNGPKPELVAFEFYVGEPVTLRPPSNCVRPVDAVPDPDAWAATKAKADRAKAPSMSVAEAYDTLEAGSKARAAARAKPKRKPAAKKAAPKKPAPKPVCRVPLKVGRRLMGR